MKLIAKPLLEGPSAKSLDIQEPLDPKTFVNFLDSHKALVFQRHGDVNPPSAEEFGRFVVSLKLNPFADVDGGAPRTSIPVSAGKDIIFTANESPLDQPIPFPNELVPGPDPPEYVFFYSDDPEGKGCQTPIIDSTLVYRFANDNYPDFVAKLKEHGVRFTRTYPAQDDSSSPTGCSYKNAWNVSSKEELETKLGSMDGFSWEWKADGSVRVTFPAVPVIRLVTDHAQNHIFQWTFCNSIIAAISGWVDRHNERHYALQFGNMDHMEEAILQSIADYMKEHWTLHSWRQGDILAINNRLVMHSPKLFVGQDGSILASIWGGPQDSVVNAQPTNGVAVGNRPSTFYESLTPPDPLVFGFWKVDKDLCEEVCYQAIQAGYRRLDCACDYGNEIEVGRGIARAVANGLVTRDDLFVTSKLWNTYHHPDHVSLAFHKSLQDLGLTYLDEYLIHFPISMEYVPIDQKYPPEWTNLQGKMVLVPSDICATWRAMETLVDESLVKQIGVCNFGTQLLRQLLSTCRIRPSKLQVEMHPHNTQSHLLRFAHDAGIRVTAFSVLGASSYISLNMATPQDLLTQNDIVVKMAQSKRKSPVQILLRWALQRNTFPLCKTCTPQRMKENRDVFDFYLTPTEMKLVDGLNQNKRYNDPGAFCEPGMGTFCPIYE